MVKPAWGRSASFQRMDRRARRREQAVVVALLRELRQQAGLRQQDLANRLSEPQSFVSKYESGERRLDVLELREVCMALGVSLDAVIQRLEQRLVDDSARAS